MVVMVQRFQQVLLSVGLMLMPGWLSAQNVITGRVLDSVSRAPVAYVNVYLANTTLGSTTDEQGVYTIGGIPDGRYDVVASFVGYHPVQWTVSLAGGESQKIAFLLSQDVIQLREVSVVADTADRAYNLQVFKRSFLGETRDARQCMVRNLKDMYLYFDRTDRLLVGHARQPLVIENAALGYRIHYTLVKFEVDFKSNFQVYLGYPRFEVYTPRSPAEQRRWARARQRNYEGSFIHFIRSLQTSELDQDFVVHELFRVPNRRRPPEKKIALRLTYLRRVVNDPNTASAVRRVAQDSLDYYLDAASRPREIDSLGRRIEHPAQLLDSTHQRLIYKGILHVIYKGEPEEMAYAQSQGRQALRYQESRIHFIGAPITLYANGYYEDARDVYFEGYMGWADKMANLLPLEYVPDADD